MNDSFSYVDGEGYEFIGYDVDGKVEGQDIIINCLPEKNMYYISFENGDSIGIGENHLMEQDETMLDVVGFCYTSVSKRCY